MSSSYFEPLASSLRTTGINGVFGGGSLCPPIDRIIDDLMAFDYFLGVGIEDVSLTERARSGLFNHLGDLFVEDDVLICL